MAIIQLLSRKSSKAPSKLYIDSMYFYGDSITYGMSSTAGNDYATKTASYFNVVKNNLAVSGECLSNYHYPNNFRDAVSTVVPSKGSLKSFLVIAFGTNDARSEYPFSGTPWNIPTLYYSQFQECLNIIYSKGWLKSEIVLITPFYDTDFDLAAYNTDRSHYEVYVQKLKDLALANEIICFDSYSYMLNNGGESLIDPTDHIHPTNAGHTVIFNGLKNILSQVINVKS